MRTIIQRAFLLSVAFFLGQLASAQSSCPEGAVDLGIVITRNGITYNLYWAKSNLCTHGLCANPEDYGDYFAWGETEPYYAEGHSQDSPCRNWKNGKDGYGVKSYKWYKGTMLGDITILKYNINSLQGGIQGVVDNIHILQRGENPDETVDDAARARLGGKWRIPTDYEWSLLMSKCRWTWTDNYNGTGIHGAIVTGGNGNSIFLPAAGQRRGSIIESAGSGSYWTSSLDDITPILAYSEVIARNPFRMRSDRTYGLSVRPVFLCVENEAHKSSESEIDGLLTKANSGDTYAQYQLGWRYDKEKNYAEAVKWYRKAAEQGYAYAQHNLGVCYKNGKGVPQNYEEAVKWYRKAAEQGATKSQYSLGVCYYFGEGVPQNYEEAVKWYRKAAEQGGDADAQYNLGVCYYFGRGVPQNYEEAVKWYRKAAEQGKADAQYNLGVCYKNGKGVPQNYEEAVKWYRKAAEQGDIDAKKALKALL